LKAGLTGWRSRAGNTDVFSGDDGEKRPMLRIATAPAHEPSVESRPAKFR
jgi:hypothetical protein